MANYRNIKGFEFYRVGDDGTVWSRKRGSEWRMLKPSRSNTGHLLVELFKKKFTNSGRYMLKVHRLVLEAFIGPCPPGCEGCHNDGDPTNNRLENLRWDTHAANMADMATHQTRAVGERCGASKLSNADAIEIDGCIFRKALASQNWRDGTCSTQQLSAR